MAKPITGVLAERARRSHFAMDLTKAPGLRQSPTLQQKMARFTFAPVSRAQTVSFVTAPTKRCHESEKPPTERLKKSNSVSKFKRDLLKPESGEINHRGNGEHSGRIQWERFVGFAAFGNRSC